MISNFFAYKCLTMESPKDHQRDLLLSAYTYDNHTMRNSQNRIQRMIKNVHFDDPKWKEVLLSINSNVSNLYKVDRDMLQYLVAIILWLVFLRYYRDHLKRRNNNTNILYIEFPSWEVFNATDASLILGIHLENYMKLSDDEIQFLKYAREIYMRKTLYSKKVETYSNN